MQTLYKKKKLQEREERAGILKAIEDDKAARRVAAGRGEQPSGEPRPRQPTCHSPRRATAPSTGRLSEHCSVQVRLFDGSTIRSRFSSRETVRKDVRQFIGENRTDGECAVYVQGAPRAVAEQDPGRDRGKKKTLQELGLVPSATLILLRCTEVRGSVLTENIFSRHHCLHPGFLQPGCQFLLDAVQHRWAASGSWRCCARDLGARTSGREERESRIRGFGDKASGGMSNNSTAGIR